MNLKGWLGAMVLKMGLTNVYVLKGGWNAWLAAGYPTQPKSAN